MHRHGDDQIARRLQISSHTLYMNELPCCAIRWSRETGVFTGPFAKCKAGGGRGVSEIATESAIRGFERHYVVMLWLPGMNKHPDA